MQFIENRPDAFTALRQWRGVQKKLRPNSCGSFNSQQVVKQRRSVLLGLVQHKLEVGERLECLY
jgi:hypothetical protein